MIDADDIRVANCSQCCREIVCPEDWAQLVPFQQAFYPAGPVRGRIEGRPYCDRCLAVSDMKRGVGSPNTGDAGPGWDNAVRTLEDH